MTVLKVGPKKSNDVKELQKLLNKAVKPSPKLDTDGIFGPGTEDAVKSFQKQNGLKADGVAGTDTLNALNGTGGGSKSGAKGKVTGKTSGVQSILIDALEAVADHYGVTIIVTSGKRSPQDQASAMWDNWKTNLKEGEIYAALKGDRETLKTLQDAYDGNDRKTFDSTVTKIASKLSRHLSGDAVDVKMNTDAKAVKAMASMFNHIEEKTCHHFDTKRAPSSINDSVKSKWP